MKKMYAKGKETHLIFIDLEKAYDSVPIKQLWEEIKGIGISLPLIALIQRLCQECQADVKIGERFTRAFQATKGLRQGCSMSPTLFKIYIHQILKKWNNSSRNGNFSWKRVSGLTAICRRSGDNGTVS